MAANRNMIDLLNDPRFDRMLFNRVCGVINARLIDGYLLLELYAVCRNLPPAWLKTLTCTVAEPHTGLRAEARITDVISQDDGHILTKTALLVPQLTDPDGLSDQAVIQLTSTSCRGEERLLRPLLLAKPQP